MVIAETVKSLQKAIREREHYGTTGLVPTMGALHAGHISLVDRCRTENGTVVASLFVNPTQFNDKNDLKHYPRTMDADLKLLEAAGCDIVFAPSVEEVYPEPDMRVFDFGSLGEVMEGALRPGHFNGVGQIVSKLFEYIRPHRAYFGEKDFQQLAIIRYLTNQLGMNIEIIGCPIIRDNDGLALSSRNMLLCPQDRMTAPFIYKTIEEARRLRDRAGVAQVKEWVKQQIDSCSDMKLEYFEIVDAGTLQNVGSWDDPCSKRGCIAVRLGSIRLIDNIKFD